MDTIKIVVAGPRGRMGIEAKERVKEFSIQNIAKEYINLYEYAINVYKASKEH